MAPFGGRNASVVFMVCTWLGLQYPTCVGEKGLLTWCRNFVRLDFLMKLSSRVFLAKCLATFSSVVKLLSSDKELPIKQVLQVDLYYGHWWTINVRSCFSVHACACEIREASVRLWLSVKTSFQCLLHDIHVTPNLGFSVTMFLKLTTILRCQPRNFATQSW